MKPDFRCKLARLLFEEKIRRVAELIWLSRNVKVQRVRENSGAHPQSDKRNKRRMNGAEPR
jgi:hypothetical protein